MGAKLNGIKMLGFLRKTNPHEAAARALYAAALARTRDPGFYTDYGVPDSFDGRFDLLLVHLFVVIDRMAGEPEGGQDFNQALFDATFANMDQTLREMGIGDMGIPKHMRRMMVAFNGRMHAYSRAIETGFFRTALANNLYGTAGEAEPARLELMEVYVRASIRALKGLSAADILAGRDVFIRN
jgi:cytochrome b pre-mRNA-processing protein 3